MKKAIAAMLALGMTLTMCGGTLVVRAEGDAKTYKVLSGSGEGVAAYDVFNAVVTKYQEEVNPEDVSRMKISQVEKNKEVLSTTE